MKIAGIYLAAGQSRRMRRSKLELMLTKTLPLGAAALLQLDAIALDSLVVVVREDDSLHWLPARTKYPDPSWRIVRCGDAAEGMSRSIQCGLRAAQRSEPDAVLIALADQPLIQSAHIARMFSVYQQHPSVDYIASEGKQGTAVPPMLLSKKLFPELEKLSGDMGARRIVHSPDVRGMTVSSESPHLWLDADTISDFTAIRSLWQELHPPHQT